jgi:UDP-3-O-[3-hydroxymyristoyl] N-acetylglucosamine deacetylase
MSDTSAWRLVEAPTETPRRSIRGHADVATGLVAPAYGPDVS